MEGAFLNEGFYLFSQFKRNGVLAQNGQSLKHTLGNLNLQTALKLLNS